MSLCTPRPAGTQPADAARRRLRPSAAGSDPRPRQQFTREFDEVFGSEGIRVIKAPVRAPKARAHVERWVGSARRECLDRLLILGRRHLASVLREYTAHYNEHRPHRSLAQRPPLAKPPPAEAPDTPAEPLVLARLRRRDRLGGLVHE